MRKKIPDYENYYIYDNGEVFNEKTQKFLKGSINNSGYKYYRLSKDNKKKMFYAHRLVAENFLIKQSNDELVVNHIDGNKINNDISNLEWTTYSQNVKHAHQNNLIKKSRKKEYYKEDFLNEKWKKIYDFNYSISTLGRVRNDKTLLLLKPRLSNGYYMVSLSKNSRIIDITIHKLVYCIFNEIRNIPSGYIIDHIDGNKTNNNLNNLRVISLRDNALAALYKTKTNKTCKQVEQLDLNDKHIAYFASCSIAARKLELDASTISKVCRGVNKSHGGFHFKYV